MITSHCLISLSSFVYFPSSALVSIVIVVVALISNPITWEYVWKLLRVYVLTLDRSFNEERPMRVFWRVCICASNVIAIQRRIQFNFSGTRFIIGRRNIWTFYVHKFPVNFDHFHENKSIKLWEKEKDTNTRTHQNVHGHRCVCFAEVVKKVQHMDPMKMTPDHFCTVVAFLFTLIVSFLMLMLLVAVVAVGHCSV